MAYIGFDFGQNFGYAILDNNGNRIKSDVTDLGKRSGKSLAKFRTILEETISFGVDAIGYEKVRRHRGVAAAHAYGGYEAIMWLVCQDLGVPVKDIVEVTVQQIKRCATGAGKAEKEEIEAQAFARWSHLTEDDNEADALFCADVCRRIRNGESI